MTSRARGKSQRSERTKGSAEGTKDFIPDAPRRDGWCQRGIPGQLRGSVSTDFWYTENNSYAKNWIAGVLKGCISPHVPK